MAKKAKPVVVKTVARSPVSQNIHATARMLFEAGAMDRQTMRKFEQSCLVELPVVTPQQVRVIREMMKVSQPVFARQIGTSASTVKKWESGDNPVKGPAAIVLRLLEKKGYESLAKMLA